MSGGRAKFALIRRILKRGRAKFTKKKSETKGGQFSRIVSPVAIRNVCYGCQMVIETHTQNTHTHSQLAVHFILLLRCDCTI